MVQVCDTLGRLSHDADEEVAMAAVLSLGLVRSVLIIVSLCWSEMKAEW